MICNNKSPRRLIFLTSLLCSLLFFNFAPRPFRTLSFQSCPSQPSHSLNNIFAQSTFTCMQMFSAYNQNRDTDIHKIADYPRGFELRRSARHEFFLAVDKLDSGVLPRTFLKYGLFAPIETAVFDKILPFKSKKANCEPVVIDVGVNIGYLTFKAASLGYEVFGFEPQARLHDLLCLTKKVNSFRSEQIYLYPFGLSSKNTIYDQVNTESWGRAHIIDDSVNNNQKRIFRKTKKIEVHRLDEILSKEVHVQLLKIDVEGHELKVLEGATGILQKGYIKNIVIELTDKYDNILKVWNLLFNDLGYNSTVYCWKEEYENITAIKLASAGDLNLSDYGSFCDTLKCVTDIRSTDCWFRYHG